MNKIKKADAAVSVFQHFVRGYLGRNLETNLETNVTDSDFGLALEQVRNYLARQLVTDALEILGQMTPQNSYEKIEHSIELARCDFLLGEFENGVQRLDLILGNSDASPVTLITAHQLKGRALHKIGDFAKAEASLLISHELSLIYPGSNSGFVAKAYLVQLYSETKRQKDAENFLTIMDSVLSTETNNDLWISRKLMALRALSHFQRAFLNPEELKETLFLAVVLAEFLNDNSMSQKCFKDLKDCGASFADNRMYRAFNGWTFLPKLNLILRDSPTEVIRLDESPVMLDTLNKLAMGPCNQINLFETIWKIPFSERHASQMRSVFSKLRQYLPEGALKVQNGMVFLE